MGFGLVLFRRDSRRLFALDGIRIFGTQSLMEVGNSAASWTVCLDAAFTRTRQSIAARSDRLRPAIHPIDHRGMDRRVHRHENS